MAFRDFLGSAKHVDDEVSAIHGMFASSKANNHELLMFNNIKEAPGHRSALNLLTGLVYAMFWVSPRVISRSTQMGHEESNRS